MIVFLTSSPCRREAPDGIDLPCILNEANGFVTRLQEHWKENSRGLVICSDPDNFDMNEEMTGTFRSVFPFHGLTFSNLTICDSRNEAEIPQLIAESDVIILGGGHVPTQNAFFQRIGLKKLLEDYAGIVIGISAGTMNSAGTVYAQPELEGESIDPDYQRFIPGLGLTDVNVLPHYQMVKDDVIDGKRLFEEITYPDSLGRKFYALVDGSYVLVCGDSTVLYGEGYLIQDGKFSQICEEGESVEI